MSQSPQTGADAAAAGMLLVAAIVTCAGAGFGIGAVLGLAVPLGLLGVFAGAVVGVVLVHARFRRL